MSELPSAIDAFRADEHAELPDARVEDDFTELQRAAELIELERLRRLAEIDRRRMYERDGHLSAASWLTASHGVARGLAQRDVKTARALGQMPATRRALEDAEISMSAARLLSDARDVEPELFAESEGTLVEAARGHSISELQRVVAFW
ncbi:MAG: hypothetical protein ACJ76P_06565 [Actinomycetota bacterium]